jgi:arsenite methyltransferase
MMTTTALPPALARALPLLTAPPAEPDVRHGYLDLLGEAGTAGATGATEAEPGLIQRLWSSGPGAAAYDFAQAQGRRLLAAWQLPADWLAPPADGVVLDIGSGPGNVTGGFGRRLGERGVALGVDLSVPMLTRAVRAEAGPGTGFLRADARRLPFADGVADVLVSIAMLQLAPDPAVVLAEFARVLKPGGRLAVMVPTVLGGWMEKGVGLLPGHGAHFFTDEEIPDELERLGVERLRSKQSGPVQWVRGVRGAGAGGPE